MPVKQCYKIGFCAKNKNMRQAEGGFWMAAFVRRMKCAVILSSIHFHCHEAKYSMFMNHNECGGQRPHFHVPTVIPF